MLGPINIEPSRLVVASPEDAVPYPAIFLGRWLFHKRSEEKNRCAAGESGEAL